ncbi:MAG: metal-sensing transcriptional repressor [Lachnospiraceae bacterium]|nr:metal-sensing transcriptional repressor [Lachnospiraceae bacterium]MBO5146796.1 metal-sensing transcriptional repressor [Lachnospiraceae bacterium]
MNSSEQTDTQMHEQMHESGIEHTHTHTHTETKAVLNRMSKIIGHMESIKTMVENGRDCSEVLIQLAAVKSAIGGVSRVILKDHIDHCIIDAVKENDTESIEELKKAIDKFL